MTIYSPKVCQVLMLAIPSPKAKTRKYLSFATLSISFPSILSIKTFAQLEKLYYSGWEPEELSQNNDDSVGWTTA
jgi:hypothetical protein